MFIIALLGVLCKSNTHNLMKLSLSCKCLEFRVMKEAYASTYFSNLFTPVLNISDFKLKNEVCSYIIFFHG